MATLQLAAQALRAWPGRTWAWAAVATAGTAVLIGVPTVMIPNSFFARDIDVVWWNYPVWLATSLLAGMLIASYVRVPGSTGGAADGPAGDSAADSDDGSAPADPEAQRQGRLAITGSLLGWFAVGCPVCNKFALLALGYSGAITWFAPIQPFLGLGALVLTGAALVMRLRGQVACPLPRAARESVGAGA